MSDLRWHEGDTLYLHREARLPFVLGECLDAGGGGVVFAIAQSDGDAVKLYSEARSDLEIVVREASIRGLQHGAPGAAVIAAPKALVFATNSQTDHDPVGTLMTRVPPVGYVRLDFFLEDHASAAPLRNRAAIAVSLTAAISCIHSARCIVGDLKPENFFVHESDFVIAVIDVDAFSFFSESGEMVIGQKATTAGYRAPELRHGGWPTMASDVFALGVIVTELLLGDIHPFAFQRISARTGSNQARIDNGDSWATSPAEFRSGSHPGLHVLPEELRTVLARAFTSSDRPDVYALLPLLSDLQASTCGVNDQHATFEGGDCERCALDPAAPAVTEIAVPALSNVSRPPSRSRLRKKVVILALLMVLLISLAVAVWWFTARQSASGPLDDPSQPTRESDALPISASPEASAPITEVAVSVATDPPDDSVQVPVVSVGEGTSTTPTVPPITESTAATTIPPPTWVAWEGSETDLLNLGVQFKSLYVRSRVTDAAEMCLVPAGELGPQSLYSFVQLQPCGPTTTPQMLFTPKGTPLGTRYEVSVDSNGARFCLGPTADQAATDTVILSFDLCSGVARDLLHVFVDPATGYLTIGALLADGSSAVIDVDYGRDSAGSPVSLYKFDYGLAHQRLDLMWIEILSG